MASSEGRIALVTGASRGLGRAVAARLVGTGYRVVGVARSARDLDALASEVAREDRFRGCALDLIQPDAPAAAVRAAVETFGGLDVLVNNAGGDAPKDLGAMTQEAWREALNLNVTSPLFLCQQALPHLRRSPAADVVMINSKMALRMPETFGTYGPSKIFLAALTAGLERELASFGIRMATIYLGGARTHFGDRPPEEKPSWWLEPEEVADVLLQVLEAPRRVWIKQLGIEPLPPQAPGGGPRGAE